jgi:hypothetical protein
MIVPLGEKQKSRESHNQAASCEDFHVSGTIQVPRRYGACLNSHLGRQFGFAAIEDAPLLRRTRLRTH